MAYHRRAAAVKSGEKIACRKNAFDPRKDFDNFVLVRLLLVSKWLIQEESRMKSAALGLLLLFFALISDAAAADKLTGFYSARTMSQSMPWIAAEASVFWKYDVVFLLVYYASE